MYLLGRSTGLRAPPNQAGDGRPPTISDYVVGIGRP